MHISSYRLKHFFSCFFFSCSVYSVWVKSCIHVIISRTIRENKWWMAVLESDKVYCLFSKSFDFKKKLNTFTHKDILICYLCKGQLRKLLAEGTLNAFKPTVTISSKLDKQLQCVIRQRTQLLSYENTRMCLKWQSWHFSQKTHILSQYIYHCPDASNQKQKQARHSSRVWGSCWNGSPVSY